MMDDKMLALLIAMAIFLPLIWRYIPDGTIHIIRDGGGNWHWWWEPRK